MNVGQSIERRAEGWILVVFLAAAGCRTQPAVDYDSPTAGFVRRMLVLELSVGTSLKECMRETSGADPFAQPGFVDGSVIVSADPSPLAMELTWNEGKNHAFCQSPPWFKEVPKPPRLNTYGFTIWTGNGRAVIYRQAGQVIEGVRLPAVAAKPGEEPRPAASNSPSDLEELERLTKELERGATQPACLGFGVLEETHPTSGLIREITVKRARACLGLHFAEPKQQTDLKAVADRGMTDFAEALANFTLGERGDPQRYSQGLDQLEALITSPDSRIAAEAKRLLQSALRFKLSRSPDPTVAAPIAERLQRLPISDEERTDVRLELARIRLWNKEASMQGQQDLLELGRLNSPVAMAARWELAAYFHSNGNYERAAELYRSISSQIKEKQYQFRFAAELQRRTEQATAHLPPRFK